MSVKVVFECQRCKTTYTANPPLARPTALGDHTPAGWTSLRDGRFHLCNSCTVAVIDNITANPIVRERGPLPG